MESQEIKSKEKFELSPKKRIALELILAGQTDAQVGAAIGKGRNTIWSWRKHDPQFIAALNQRRSWLQNESVEQMNALCSQSIQLLEKAVEKGDTETIAVTLALKQFWHLGFAVCLATSIVAIIADGKLLF